MSGVDDVDPADLVEVLQPPRGAHNEDAQAAAAAAKAKVQKQGSVKWSSAPRVTPKGFEKSAMKDVPAITRVASSDSSMSAAASGASRPTPESVSPMRVMSIGSNVSGLQENAEEALKHVAGKSSSFGSSASEGFGDRGSDDSVSRGVRFGEVSKVPAAVPRLEVEQPKERKKRSNSFSLNSTAAIHSYQDQLATQVATGQRKSIMQRKSVTGIAMAGILPGWLANNDETNQGASPVKSPDEGSESGSSDGMSGEESELFSDGGSQIAGSRIESRQYDGEDDFCEVKDECNVEFDAGTAKKVLQRNFTRNMPDAHDETLIDEYRNLPFIFTERANVFFGSMIFLNAAYIGWETDRGDDLSREFWLVCEGIFLLVFLVEIVLRISYHKKAPIDWDEDAGPFYKNMWNVLDLVVVITGLFDMVVLGLILENAVGVEVGHDSPPHELHILRAVNIFRTFRYLRVFRIFRFLSELLLLAHGIMDAMKALVWAMLLVLLVLYTCSLFTTKFLGQAGAPNGHRHADDVQDWFGNVPKSLFSLFQLMTLEEWPTIARITWNVMGVPWAFFFFLFVSFTHLLLLNLVSGIILEHVLASSRREEEKALQKEEEKRMNIVFSVHALFDSVLGDREVDEICIEEFRQACRDPKVLRQLASLQIAVYEAEELFTLMDTAKRGAINIDHFIEGCLRIRGAARAKHLLAVQFDVQKVWSKLSEQLDEVEDTLVFQVQRAAQESSDIVQETVDELKDTLQSTIADTIRQSLEEVLPEVLQMSAKEMLREAAQDLAQDAAQIALREFAASGLHHQGRSSVSQGAAQAASTGDGSAASVFGVPRPPPMRLSTTPLALPRASSHSPTSHQDADAGAGGAGSAGSGQPTPPLPPISVQTAPPTFGNFEGMNDVALDDMFHDDIVSEANAALMLVPDVIDVRNSAMDISENSNTNGSDPQVGIERGGDNDLAVGAKTSVHSSTLASLPRSGVSAHSLSVGITITPSASFSPGDVGTERKRKSDKSPQHSARHSSITPSSSFSPGKYSERNSVVTPSGSFHPGDGDSHRKSPKKWNEKSRRGSSSESLPSPRISDHGEDGARLDKSVIRKKGTKELMLPKVGDKPPRHSNRNSEMSASPERQIRASSRIGASDNSDEKRTSETQKHSRSSDHTHGEKHHAHRSSTNLSSRVLDAADRLLDLRRVEEGLLSRLETVARSRHSELSLISRLLSYEEGGSSDRVGKAGSQEFLERGATSHSVTSEVATKHEKHDRKHERRFSNNGTPLQGSASMTPLHIIRRHSLENAS